jgi:hypothetical protein
MRTLMKVQVPVEAGNKAFLSGELPKVIMATVASLKPEAAYFYAERGVRTAIMVFDLKATSDIPVIAEPLFTKLNAAVEFSPVMNGEDLQAGLSKSGR